MPYNGNVEIVGGLKPKNNANFKLINAKDIYYSDDKDLLDVLGGFEEKGVREYIDNALGTDDKSGINGRIASLENNAANVNYVNEVKTLAESKLDQAGFDNKFNTSFETYTTNLDTHFSAFKTEVQDSLSGMKHITDHFKIVNSEHIAVETDAAGHILEYTDMDGTKYFTGKVKFGSGASFSTMNGEYLDVKIDSSQRIIEYTDLMGNVHFNGELYAKNFTLGSNAKMYTGGYEYAAVDVDASQRIIEYTDILGAKHFPGDVYVKNQLIVGAGAKSYTLNPYEYLDLKMDASQNIVEATMPDGVKYFPAGFKTNAYKATSLRSANEYLAIVVDQAQNILEGTYQNGDKYFPANVFSKNINSMSNTLGDIASTLNYVTSQLYSKNIIPEQPEIVYEDIEDPYAMP